MTIALQEGPLETGRLTLHHLRTFPQHPRAPRILLLGGSNFDLRLKRAFLDTPLAQSCQLVTFEPRGIGRSDQPPGDWTMEDYAADALAVLDAMHWDQAVIVGESFGGMTALHLARMAPDRVQRMVIASATAGGPVHASHDISAFLDLPREAAARAALCLQDSRKAALSNSDPQAFAKDLAARLRFEEAFADPSITSGGYARLLAARRGHDVTESLAKIKAPTHVIAGRFDHQCRPEAQDHLARSLPQGSFQCFDAGHGVLFAHPEAMAATMQFITASEAGRAALGP